MCHKAEHNPLCLILRGVETIGVSLRVKNEEKMRYNIN